MMRITFENIPQYVVQIYLQNELRKFGCGQSQSELFLQVSLGLSALNLVQSIVMSLYNFCTWRSTLYKDVDQFVPAIVKDRKQFIVTDWQVICFGQFCDSMGPHVFFELLLEIMTENSFVTAI